MSKEITYTVTVTENGTQYWYLDGLHHREDGPAAIYADGEQQWYLNGKLHRVDGPAVTCANGNQIWSLNGKLHRKDGPAIIYANGDQFWFLNGIEFTEAEFIKATSVSKELIVAEIEQLLGYKVKVVK